MPQEQFEQATAAPGEMRISMELGKPVSIEFGLSELVDLVVAEIGRRQLEISQRLSGRGQ